MRRRRVAEKTIRRDEWEAHETVTIKGFTAADTQWVQDTAMILKDQELRVLSGSQQLCTLLRGISRWTLTDERGQGYPWPPLFDGQGNLIAENLEMRKRVLMSGELMPEDAKFIYDEIGLLNQFKSKEEQEAFLASVSAPSSVNSEMVNAHQEPLQIGQ